ncbi:MAG: DUF5711 family protein [Ruminiclostridium sp.]|nr:DUF5711 family protein [Ruminiclostridium sp.]
MKILESEEQRVKDAAEAKEIKQAMNAGSKNNATDLTKYRKKKKRSKYIVRLLIILAVVTVFAVVWINADKIFEPLRGIASKVETKTSYDEGFPVELPGSARYSLMRTGEGFTLLTDTYLYSYDTDGAQIYALKHGYNNPELSTSEKRILLFDKSGYNFSLYSRTSLMYKKAVDDKIMYASVGNDNLTAVVTRSDRYSNILYIYDDGGNWKYTRKFADENVIQVSMPGDGEHIIVSTLSSLNGDIITNIYKFSIKSADGNIWRYTFRNNSLPCGLYSDKENVIAVCDNTVLSLKSADGTLSGSFPFSGTLRGLSISPEYTAILCNDISSSRHTVTVLDANAAEVGTANVSSNTVDILADDSGIYVLDGTKLRIFDHTMTDENDVAVENEGYTELIRIGGSAFMLGYRNIDKTELPSAKKPEAQEKE